MNNPDLLDGYEFLWVDDKVELFFLQIQGSGRIALENGKILNIGYAEHNGFDAGHQTLGPTKSGET